MSYNWQDIKESVRFDDVLTDLDIDIVPENRKGWQNSSCPLPTHHGRDLSPSFGVNEESLSFKCYACDESGNLVRLVELIKGFDRAQALEYLAGFSDVELEDEEQIISQIDRWFAVDTVERSRAVVLPYFHPQALDEYPFAPIELLEKWGIKNWSTVQAFKVRLAEDYVRASYSGPALLIPHYVGGDLVGWQARWLEAERPDWVPKYTNTSDFPRETTLWNYDRAYSVLHGDLSGEFCIVVESVMTVIRLWELGYTAVATFGSAITPEQRKLLRSFDRLVLALDADARKQIVTQLASLEDDVSIQAIAPLAGNKTDLADLPDEAIHDALFGF